MRFCSVCRSTTYCSVSCQKKDWKRHQLTCGQQPEAGADGANATPEPQPSEQTGQAAATASASSNPTTTTAPTTTNKDAAAATEATQQLTHKDSEPQNDPAQSGGIMTTTNIIIGGVLSVGLAVAGWFAYSYISGSADNQRKQQQPPPKGGRRPPQQRR